VYLWRDPRGTRVFVLALLVVATALVVVPWRITFAAGVIHLFTKKFRDPAPTKLGTVSSWACVGAR
jgi:hypothetical protein